MSIEPQMDVFTFHHFNWWLKFNVTDVLPKNQFRNKHIIFLSFLIKDNNISMGADTRTFLKNTVTMATQKQVV